MCACHPYPLEPRASGVTNAVTSSKKLPGSNEYSILVSPTCNPTSQKHRMPFSKATVASNGGQQSNGGMLAPDGFKELGLVGNGDLEGL